MARIARMRRAERGGGDVGPSADRRQLEQDATPGGWAQGQAGPRDSDRGWSGVGEGPTSWNGARLQQRHAGLLRALRCWVLRGRRAGDAAEGSTQHNNNNFVCAWYYHLSLRSEPDDK